MVGEVTDDGRHGTDSGAAGARQPEPGHHPDISGGWLRAATFGAMDGLVTNIALIAGVGGGGVAAGTIVLAGAVGLIAGAISMAFGEYTSVKTQNEQIAREVARERAELASNPVGESQELARIWTERGISADVARQMAETLRGHPEEALRFHVQEELGVSPTYAPSPWVAAFSSFGTFAVGALIPLLPYLLGAAELWLALGVGGLGLAAAGAIAARFTGRPRWFGAGRQVVLGGAAALATYLVGGLIGTTIA
jgi:VIT1/CCC1 family predicted Fe2+/Mn2+ transporter